MLDNNENLATISEFADYLEEAISEVNLYWNQWIFKKFFRTLHLRGL